MANHVNNFLKIIGDDQQVKSVRNFIKSNPDSKGNEMYIDFDKILKMPTELEIESDTTIYWLMDLLFGNDEYDLDSFKKIQKTFTNLNEKEQIEFTNLAVKYRKNREKHGACCWYDWRNIYWETKWNAFQQDLIAENEIFFRTAWNGVPRLITILSQKFPAVKFEYKWDDYLTGIKDNIVLINGESIEQ